MQAVRKRRKNYHSQPPQGQTQLLQSEDTKPRYNIKLMEMTIAQVQESLFSKYIGQAGQILKNKCF
jgi:hypothetical protein